MAVGHSPASCEAFLEPAVPSSLQSAYDQNVELHVQTRGLNPIAD